MRWCQACLEMNVRAITQMFTFKLQNVFKDTMQNKRVPILIHGKASLRHECVRTNVLLAYRISRHFIVSGWK